MKIKTAKLAAIAAVIVVAGSGFHWVQKKITVVQQEMGQRRSNDSASISRPIDVVRRVQKPSAEQLRQHYENFMANRPLYLANIDLPGRYSVDADGNLIIDSGMKEMLDFFFLGVGDLSFEEIHDLIAGSMIDSLQEPARAQALAFLDRYFSYIDSYDQWQQSFDKDSVAANDPTDTRNKLAELTQLRRQQLGDDAYDAFFAESDEVNSAYLDAQISMKQPNLTAADKADIRSQLNDALPPTVRQAQQATMTLVNLEQKTRQLQSQGASDSDIFQARAAMVGADAAQRLAQVDDEQRAWTQKRDQYEHLVHATSGLDNMATAERENYISDLAQRELGLNANEVRRMQALERIDAATAADTRAN